MDTEHTPREMDEATKRRVAQDSMSKATAYTDAGNWLRAFPHYLTFFELMPEERFSYPFEVVFETVVDNCGQILEEEGRYEDLCKCYRSALRYFPQNLFFLHTFGRHLLRQGKPEVALEVLETAHDFTLSSIQIETDIVTAKLDIIPRWHYRMLNDRRRNEAYRAAIHGAVTTQHNRVLDVGSGCGLLSFYASECKDAQGIIAVESNKTLCDIARRALEERTGIVQVINDESTNLTGDIIGLSNLLVTEIFDCGLFGEHVLEMLIHAWDKLLEPSAKIIPHSAELFVTGINSNPLLIRQKYVNSFPRLDLALNSVPNCIRQVKSEPYAAENLKDEVVQYVTSTERAISVDFNNVEQLKTIYSQGDSIPVVTLKCLKNETIDAFAVWFNLHLDENTSITTNPQEDSVTCWEQAVFYLDHPVLVEEGEEIKLRVSCVEDKLKIEILDRPSSCPKCNEVSKEMVTFLNDTLLVEAAEDLTLPTRFNEQRCEVIDLNPFPLFALFRAMKGFAGTYTCVGENEADLKFIASVWRNNGFPGIRTGAAENSDITFQLCVSSELYDNIPARSVDLIFYNPISNNGTPCETSYKAVNFLERNAIKEDGLILPRLITLQMELIDSKYLDFCSKVNDKNLLGLKVADAINRYTVLEQWQVEPRHYRRTTLGNFEVSYYTLENGGTDDEENDYDIPIPMNGIANGVLYWYIMEYTDQLRVNTYKSLHYKSACAMFRVSRKVKPGDTIKVRVMQQGCQFIISNADDDD